MLLLSSCQATDHCHGITTGAISLIKGYFKLYFLLLHLHGFSFCWKMESLPQKLFLEENTLLPGVELGSKGKQHEGFTMYLISNLASVPKL